MNAAWEDFKSKLNFDDYLVKYTRHKREIKERSVKECVEYYPELNAQIMYMLPVLIRRNYDRINKFSWFMTRGPLKGRLENLLSKRSIECANDELTAEEVNNYVRLIPGQSNDMLDPEDIRGFIDEHLWKLDEPNVRVQHYVDFRDKTDTLTKDPLQGMAHMATRKEIAPPDVKSKIYNLDVIASYNQDTGQVDINIHGNTTLELLQEYLGHMKTVDMETSYGDVKYMDYEGTLGEIDMDTITLESEHDIISDTAIQLITLKDLFDLPDYMQNTVDELIEEMNYGHFSLKVEPVCNWKFEDKGTGYYGNLNVKNGPMSLNVEGKYSAGIQYIDELDKVMKSAN